MLKRCACLLVVGLMLGADQPSDSAKKDLAKLQGEWKPEKAQRGGKDVPAEVLNKLTIKFKDDSMVIDDGSARENSAKITLDPSQSPAALEIHPKSKPDRTVRGIYNFTGDTLTLCWSREGARPSAFVSKEKTDQVLFVLKRAKK